ncbi:efflux RND transporter periplasmic adaptor subunit [Pseudoalteromonas fenneropenaei]|uniref:Efflux RND transporter periplasmic adaptor subunit n=1 Tax=Pseudoalteromonas fenneropenaei TaxID=1737459 RepID=A0ABV7CGE9_9GAMM
MIRDTSGQDIVVKSKSKIWRNGVIVAAALLVMALSANAIMNSSGAAKSIARDSVQIAAVIKGDLVRDLIATGRIVAANAPQVYSPEQGFVDLQVKAGDTVSEGQIVAIVDSPELNNELKQQRSELDRVKGELARKELEARRQTLNLNKQLDMAQVELNAAERENRRAQLSIKQHLISQIDLEKAVDDLARAKLTFKHAEQEVLLARDTLAFDLQAAKSTVARQQLVVDELVRQVGNLTITASVAGIVGNLNVQPKALVSKNQALMTLVDLSAYEAELQVPESYANELGLGMVVELKIGANLVTGTLSAISPEVTNREVTTRVRFDQADLTGIRQNQQLSARVLLENKPEVLKVKRGAFTQSGGFVAYKLSGNVAERIEIRTGAVSVSEVEILSGLNVGDQIIISNYEAFNQAPSVQLN